MVVLQPEVLERAHAGLPAARWTSRLHEAGLLVDLSGVEAPEADTIRALRADVTRLQAVEDSILLARQPIPWLVGSVSPAVVWIVVGTGAVAWVGAGWMGIAVTPVILGVYALVGLAYAARMERRRRRALVDGMAEQARLGAAIEAAFARVLAAPFVLRAPGGLVISAPQRLWLALRLRDLRVAGEGRALAERIGAELERVDQAIRRGDPDGLEVDVPGIAHEFDALGVRPGGKEGERFDREVRG